VRLPPAQHGRRLLLANICFCAFSFCFGFGIGHRAAAAFPRSDIASFRTPTVKANGHRNPTACRTGPKGCCLRSLRSSQVLGRSLPLAKKRTGGGVGGVRHQHCAMSSRRRGGLGKYYSKRLAAACTACLGMRPGMCAASAATDSYICIRSSKKLLYSRIAASSMTSSAKGIW